MVTVKQIKRTYYWAISLFWLATALPIALQVLLLQARGFTLFQLGIGMAVYSLTIVLLEVPTGGLADAVGRKRVALIAYTLMAITSAALLAAFTFPTLIVGFILYGAGRALASGALDAWFVDALQAVDADVALQPAFAKAGTFTLLALGIGALLGSAVPRLFHNLPAEGTAVLTPLSMPILIAFFCQLILILYVAVAVKESRPDSASTNWRKGFQDVPVLVKDAFQLSRQNRIILLLLGAALGGGLAGIIVETFWQPQLSAVLAGSTENTILFGIVMAGSFLVGMAGNLLSTPLSHLLNHRYALVGALTRGLQGICLILLARQTAVPLFTLFFWLVYLNMGIIDSPHNTLVNNEIPAERRSAMLSVQSLAGYVGSMIGSIGLGYLAQQASIPSAWIVAGVVLMLSLLLYLRVDRLQFRQARHHDAESSILETG
ncbi:MAG: MFS transporter [Anaerolineales bacterium]|nr:MFS transporter [Anaerolineales bacterium]